MFSRRSKQTGIRQSQYRQTDGNNCQESAASDTAPIAEEVVAVSSLPLRWKFSVYWLTLIPATTMVMVPRSYPRDESVLEPLHPSRARETNGRTGRPRLITDLKIQWACGPTSLRDQAPRTVAARPQLLETTGGKRRVLHRNLRPTCPQPPLRSTSDCRSMQGLLGHAHPPEETGQCIPAPTPASGANCVLSNTPSGSGQG